MAALVFILLLAVTAVLGDSAKPTGLPVPVPPPGASGKDPKTASVNKEEVVKEMKTALTNLNKVLEKPVSQLQSKEAVQDMDGHIQTLSKNRKKLAGTNKWVGYVKTVGGAIVTGAIKAKDYAMKSDGMKDKMMGALKSTNIDTKLGGALGGLLGGGKPDDKKDAPAPSAPK